MTDLQIFNNDQFGQIRTTVKDGAPLFVAADVCRALEISKYRDAVSRLDEDERGSFEVDTPGGTQKMTAVTESGLYSLVLGSRKPEAKAFKRWITHDVIPAIRKTGGYVDNEQQFVETYLPFADANTKALVGQTLAQLRAANEQLEQQKPKVLFADAVSAAHTSILVGELAKLLKQNGVDIGQHRLFQYLRENGYLIKRRGSDYNMPTQYAMERGWFEIKETAITHGDGHTSVNKTPKVTGKGQQYFINLFLKGA